MIKVLLLLFLLLFFSSCSFKSPQNEWQKKSSNAFSSYTKNFLSNNSSLAENDLNRAIKHAKQSADLKQLAGVYLGECALNISVGIEDSCQKYLEISDVVKSKKLDSYYKFITHSISKGEIQYLPQNYQEYILNIQSSNFKEANKNILNMQRVTSTLLCAVLIEKNLESSSREKITKLVSFYGYKKAVLFWLNEQKKYEIDKEKIRVIDKKISILNY